MTKFRVQTNNVVENDTELISNYDYHTTKVIKNDASEIVIEPSIQRYQFKTSKQVPKRLGVMLVGLGGNNGTTLTCGILANRHNVTWETKDGTQQPNYFGSITQCSTVRVGAVGPKEIYVPLSDLVPMVNPNDHFEIGGWDISGMDMVEATKRAKVLPFELQSKLAPFLKQMGKPLPAIYAPDFIASNQEDRADNVLPKEWTMAQQVTKIRQDIQDMKKKCDKVIVLWTANTERFAKIVKGVNDTADNLLKAIQNHTSGEVLEISPSSLYCVASILEGCSYINGSPQNTFVPGVAELAQRHQVFIGGDDFKSGQTKMKSVLVDFLVQAGLKPTSIVSYNHLGNNDGKNLSEEAQFRSKEISKSNVVDDMVESNHLLYQPGEKPDHVVVIKYVPFVGDSKRALDEYTSQIFLNGNNTIALHNTCEDSLLASPLMIDLIVLTELMERVSWKTPDMSEYERFHSVLSILSYLLKAPNVPEGTPLVNALFRQKQCIDNILRALVGLPPDNSMLLESKAIPRKDAATTTTTTA